MGAGSFLRSSITIPKGSKLLLVDDVAALHILANGSWQNGVAKPANESGAPRVNNVQIKGGSTQIGPFTTAGTYHIFCLVHQGMNLTIIVE
jgi:plastocyanin